MGNTETSKFSIFITCFRWFLFIIVFLIPAAAFLEGEYVTCISGIVFGLFLTFHQDNIKNKLNASYFLVFVFILLIFLVSSYLDAVIIN